MKTILTIITVLGLVILSAGCDGAAGKKELLTVDFQKARRLRYKFVSAREISLDWKRSKSKSKQRKNKADLSTESVEMVVAYKGVEVDPYGLTTIEATCESVKVKRSSPQPGRSAKRDAVQSFSGKTFTFTVGPTGKIEDYSQLDKLIKEVGKKAFRSGTRGGRIKEPDMIGDFVATQWFLWDAVSSIETGAEGVAVGQSWKSKLSMPTPMVMRKARDVTYSLEEIRQTDKGKIAVIHSSYQPAESVPNSWPIPYAGRFQVAGKFGFLRNYKVVDLQGSGTELFNIDAGRTEQYNQHYQLTIEASLPPAFGANPLITIKQNLTMNILED